MAVRTSKVLSQARMVATILKGTPLVCCGEEIGGAAGYSDNKNKNHTSYNNKTRIAVFAQPQQSHAHQCHNQTTYRFIFIK